MRQSRKVKRLDDIYASSYLSKKMKFSGKIDSNNSLTDTVPNKDNNSDCLSDSSEISGRNKKKSGKKIIISDESGSGK